MDGRYRRATALPGGFLICAPRRLRAVARGILTAVICSVALAFLPAAALAAGSNTVSLDEGSIVLSQASDGTLAWSRTAVGSTPTTYQGTLTITSSSPQKSLDAQVIVTGGAHRVAFSSEGVVLSPAIGSAIDVSAGSLEVTGGSLEASGSGSDAVSGTVVLSNVHLEAYENGAWTEVFSTTGHARVRLSGRASTASSAASHVAGVYGNTNTTVNTTVNFSSLDIGSYGETRSTTEGALKLSHDASGTPAVIGASGGSDMLTLSGGVLSSALNSIENNTVFGGGLWTNNTVENSSAGDLPVGRVSTGDGSGSAVGVTTVTVTGATLVTGGNVNVSRAAVAFANATIGEGAMQAQVALGTRSIATQSTGSGSYTYQSAALLAIAPSGKASIIPCTSEVQPDGSVKIAITEGSETAISEAETITPLLVYASDLELTVEPGEATYTGSPVGLKSVAATIGGVAAKGAQIEYSTDGGTTWSTTAPTRTNVGITSGISVRATLAGYATQTRVGLSITVAPAAATVAATDLVKTYGEKDPELTATVSGTIGSDRLTYSLSRAAGEDAGTYAITPAGDTTQGNYSVTYVAGTLTVKKAASSENPVTVTSFSGTYDGKAHSVSASAAQAGSTILYSTDGTTWTETAPTWTDVTASPATVYVRATNPNYEDSFATGTVTIAAQPAATTVAATTVPATTTPATTMPVQAAVPQTGDTAAPVAVICAIAVIGVVVILLAVRARKR